MTIQLSTFLWSIICFCLMMLILNKLLFGPMLRFMDARQERIDRAQEKKKADEAALKNAQAACEQALEDARQQQLVLNATVAEEAQAQAAAALAAAKKRQEQQLSHFAETLEQESQELKTKLDAGVEPLAKAFADRLAS